MRCKILISLIMITISGNFALADCPSADLTGDCFVDFEDFALMANQWLTIDPCVPYDMVYIPDGNFVMGDHFTEGNDDELPLHDVLLDAFFMSKFEITNRQYCDYLNSTEGCGEIKVDGGIVYASSDDSNSYPYCNTHNYSTYYSQIDYNDVSGTFSVRNKDGRDMSDDPMVEVSWYGAAAYCNWRSSEEGKESCYNLSTWDCNFATHGYRLPTEAEWEYAARGGLSGKRFPWSDPNISHSRANYHASPGSYPYDENPTSGHHPLWIDGILPFSSPVGFFDGTMKYKAGCNWPGSATSYQTTSGANNYGLYDMAGNAWEWCNDWYSMGWYNSNPTNNPTGPITGTSRVRHGGSWSYYAYHCRVACRDHTYPTHRGIGGGFRIVLDSE